MNTYDPCDTRSKSTAYRWSPCMRKTPINLDQIAGENGQQLKGKFNSEAKQKYRNELSYFSRLNPFVMDIYERFILKWSWHTQVDMPQGSFVACRPRSPRCVLCQIQCHTCNKFSTLHNCQFNTQRPISILTANFRKEKGASCGKR